MYFFQMRGLGLSEAHDSVSLIGLSFEHGRERAAPPALRAVDERAFRRRSIVFRLALALCSPCHVIALWHIPLTTSHT